MLLLENEADIDQLLGVLKVTMIDRLKKVKVIRVDMTVPVIEYKPIQRDVSGEIIYQKLESEPGSVTIHI